MRPFVRPEKTFKRIAVVGSNTTEAARVVHPATREQDAQNLARIQSERALKPPPRKIPTRQGPR